MIRFSLEKRERKLSAHRQFLFFWSKWDFTDFDNAQAATNGRIFFFFVRHKIYRSGPKITLNKNNKKSRPVNFYNNFHVLSNIRIFLK